ncbi:hypothetical protein ACFOON_09230 [Novosphingobium piscinae]|uniref:Uncharacterized protein n=1 Tax=Novosphingobium piscinae TaxID=1507448 RepID=A0A7X1FY32_9SPHN|nr:hypothetical protein [Novosphingobium piscinae]MBC2669143.1 hypothetical protein [Novosphingobium piscinae]
MARLLARFRRLERRRPAAHKAMMVWDLGKAMRRKEEFESARLIDFAFRQRARALRLLIGALGLGGTEPAAPEPAAPGQPDPGATVIALAAELAVLPDALVVERLAELSGLDRDAVAAHLPACMAEARRQVIAERGDPSPIRLG